MNKVILCGRIVKDVELTYAGETAIATATMAIDKPLSNAKKQEMESKGKPTADFPRLKVIGKRAETFANYLSKGNKVLVEGSIQTGSYDNKDGNKVYTTDVLVNNFEFVEPKKQQDDDSIAF